MHIRQDQRANNRYDSFETRHFDEGKPCGEPPCTSLVQRSRLLIQKRPHPRRPRRSQSGREKRRDESFQVRAEEPLGTHSHRTISKNSSGCRLLIGHKKCFVLLCPIGEHFLLSSFPEFVHDGYCLATLARFVHQACACKGNFHFYFPN